MLDGRIVGLIVAALFFGVLGFKVAVWLRFQFHGMLFMHLRVVGEEKKEVCHLHYDCVTEKYLQECWPLVTRALKEQGVACQLNLVFPSPSCPGALDWL